MPVPTTPDEQGRRALLILLLLAREAALAPEQVDGPQARALAVAGLGAAPRAHHGPTGRRHWMCRRRWTA